MWYRTPGRKRNWLWGPFYLLPTFWLVPVWYPGWILGFAGPLRYWGPTPDFVGSGVHKVLPHFRGVGPSMRGGRNCKFRGVLRKCVPHVVNNQTVWCPPNRKWCKHAATLLWVEQPFYR